MESGRMRLRSHVTETEKQNEKKKQEEKQIVIEKLPYIKFNGKLIYHTTLIDCAMHCEKLLEDVEKSQDLCVMGFDMEWPFSFQTGPGKTALLQICPNFAECYLFHVHGFKKLPLVLTKLLEHPRVQFAGVNIKNDIRKLSRDFPGVNADLIIEKCIDSRTQANKILENKRIWSMEKLVGHLLKMQINKDPTVRKSKWHILPLSKAQIAYAAIDAYASLKLYHHLKDLEKEVAQTQNIVEN